MKVKLESLSSLNMLLNEVKQAKELSENNQASLVSFCSKIEGFPSTNFTDKSLVSIPVTKKEAITLMDIYEMLYVKGGVSSFTEGFIHMFPEQSMGILFSKMREIISGKGLLDEWKRRFENG